MRFVEGTDLETRLRGCPLEPADAVHVVAQVASALDAAHARGLVHRDVKPANVLIAAGTQVDRPDHVYLTDFGLTKHRGTQTGLTGSGGFLGTLAYIAPEQIEGREVDGRTDQYSLACMAFECLTGAPPFVRPNDVAVINAHLHDRPPSLQGTVPTLPSAADAVMARAMAKKPETRYATCGAFIDALREALGVRPTERHARPAAGRSRRAAIVIGGMGVIALVGIAGAAALIAGGTASPRPTLGSSGGTSPSIASSASPAGSAALQFPTLDEAALVLALPPTLPANCVRGDEGLLNTVQGPSLQPRAHVTCTLTGTTGPDAVDGYVLPPVDFGPWDVIDGIARRENIGPGDCASSAEARGLWQVGDRVGGDLICYGTEDGDAVIAWDVNDIRVIFTAVDHGGDPASLYAWFQANAADIIPRSP